MNETITNVAAEPAPFNKPADLASDIEAGLDSGAIVLQTQADKGDETTPID